MKKSFLKKVVYIPLICLVSFYVLYHLFSFIFPNIKTETAYMSHSFDAIDSNAFIIRDEKSILNDTDGYVNFVLTDGDKISKDGVIAQVYSTEEQGLVKKKIKNIENEIERLENLENFGIALSTSPSSIERQAYQELNGLLKSVNNSEYQKLQKYRNKILSLLNKRQLAIGNTFNFSDKKILLKKEIEDINVKNDGEIKNILAEESGYFLGKTDGYENIYDYNNVLNITSDKVKSLIESKEPFEKTFAKLVKSSMWYAVCNVQKDEALKFHIDQYVSLSMPLASSDKIKAKVVAINQENKNSPAAIVFQCDYIDKNVLSIRKEPIKIIIEEYSGISVNKKAIHEQKIMVDNNDEEKSFEKTVKGVYVRQGKQIVFKEVDIVFSSDDYVLCNPIPDKTNFNSDNTIKEYDEIVVQGKGLYDKKIVR